MSYYRGAYKRKSSSSSLSGYGAGAVRVTKSEYVGDIVFRPIGNVAGNANATSFQCGIGGQSVTTVGNPASAINTFVAIPLVPSNPLFRGLQRWSRAYARCTILKWNFNSKSVSGLSTSSTNPNIGQIFMGIDPDGAKGGSGSMSSTTSVGAFTCQQDFTNCGGYKQFPTVHNGSIYMNTKKKTGITNNFTFDIPQTNQSLDHDNCAGFLNVALKGGPAVTNGWTPAELHTDYDIIFHEPTNDVPGTEIELGYEHYFSTPADTDCTAALPFPTELRRKENGLPGDASDSGFMTLGTTYNFPNDAALGRYLVIHHVIGTAAATAVPSFAFTGCAAFADFKEADTTFVPALSSIDGWTADTGTKAACVAIVTVNVTSLPASIAISGGTYPTAVSQSDFVVIKISDVFNTTGPGSGSTASIIN